MYNVYPWVENHRQVKNSLATIFQFETLNCVVYENIHTHMHTQSTGVSSFLIFLYSCQYSCNVIMDKASKYLTLTLCSRRYRSDEGR